MMLRGNSRREDGQIKHKLANSVLSASAIGGRGISQLTCPILLRERGMEVQYIST
jgi:hypothetical protein